MELLYNLRSGMIIHSANALLQALAIWYFLCFHVSLRIVSSSFIDNVIGIFHGYWS